MDTYRFAILGGGMVAGYAAQRLVELGLPSGDLVVVSADDAPPYERPPLSKGYLAGSDDEASVAINPAGWYADHGIAVRLSSPVERLEGQDKKLQLRSGETLRFDRLLIATGAEPRRFHVDGAELAGIHYLRLLRDSRAIRDATGSAHQAVVAGAGFIGMEVAAVLASKGIATTQVFPEERVWQALFTPEISAFFERYYAERGVKVTPGASVAGFEGNGRVERVKLASGDSLPADLVVAGIGVVPTVSALEDSGLAIDNGIVVNEYLETNLPGIWAAGDVANYYDPLFEKRRRVEHWDNAVEQGKHAAGALMGEREPFVHVPYFFSDVFDLSYEYWGDTAGATDVKYRGSFDDASFSAWWVREGTLVAAFVLNRDDEERDLAQKLIAEKGALPAGWA